MEIKRLSTGEHVSRALKNWLHEALQAASLDQWDVPIAFDDRDFLERQIAAGYELSPAQREALATADDLLAKQASRMIMMFGWDHWYEDTPEDHYARRFVQEHGGSA